MVVDGVSTRLYRLLLGLTAVTAIILFFGGIGDIPLMSLNEGRRALAIKEMFSTQAWLLPTLNGELYLTKPPLLYWVSCVFASLLGGVTETTLRLPSALAALITTVITYLYVKRTYHPLAALFSAQLMLANVAFVMLARRVEIEMLLTCLCVSAVLSAMMFIRSSHEKGWLYLSYVCLGLAILTKGPIALLFVTLPLLVAACWTKLPQLKQYLVRPLPWVLGLTIGISWFALVTYQLGPDSWKMIAQRDMLEKIQSESAAKPWLSYLGWIAVDTLMLVAVLFIQPKRLYARYQRNPEFIVLVFCTVVPLLIFSLISNKHNKYLLPIYPLMAILLGLQMHLLFEQAGQKVKKLMLTLGLLLPMVFVIFYQGFEPKVFYYRVSAFPEFVAWSKTAHWPLYALEHIDQRLIYYSQQPVKRLRENEIDTALGHQSAYLLIDTTKRKALGIGEDCIVKSFDPYLKKNKRLDVVGLGEACS